MTISFVRGSRTGEQISLDLTGLVLIGRSHYSGIRLTERDVAGQHIAIVQDYGGAIAICLSLHGFKWNGSDVMEGDHKKLNVGDEIAIGSRVSFRVDNVEGAITYGSREEMLNARFDEIRKLIIDGELLEAIRTLKVVLCLEPNHIRAKTLLGTCYWLRGDDEAFKRVSTEVALLSDAQIEKNPDVVRKCVEQFSVMDGIDAIEKIMSTEGAVRAMVDVKALKSKHPTSVLAKMVYGAYRLFLGDEEAFKRIHREIAMCMEKSGADAANDAEAYAVRGWCKYCDAFKMLYGTEK